MLNLSFVTKQNLTELSHILGSKVYIVGGAVRDMLIGFTPTDFDITSDKTPEEVVTALEGSLFKVYTTAKKLGTLKIVARDQSYEYTTFRTDSYPLDGSHAPTKVVFTKNIEEDAQRRDFKLNAIYYDVVDERLVDVLGGFSDIKRRIISTTVDADKVLRDDGLRILRLVRTAAETGFDIDENTFTVAKKCAYLTKDLAIERIREEFDKILVADTKNNIEGAQYRGLHLLLQLGVFDYFMSEILENLHFPQKAQKHKYDVLEHIFVTVKECSPDVRLAAFFHDIGKARTKIKDGNMHRHAEVSSEMTYDIMTRLKYPKQQRDEVVRLVNLHMFDIGCTADERQRRIFIQKNIDILDNLIALKHADHRAKGFDEQFSPSALLLNETRKNMAMEGVPFAIKDLKVNGKDLVSIGVEGKNRSKALEILLEECTTNKELLTREGQLSFLKNLQL